MIDGNINLKLIDFGLATNNSIVPSEQIKGTLHYMPPEDPEFKKYDVEKYDVFSLGVVLFSLVAGKFPFQEASQDDDNYSEIYY